MKLITIMNYPEDDRWMLLCDWWVQQARKHFDGPIEVWHDGGSRNWLQKYSDKLSIISKKHLDISSVLPYNMVCEKSQHNVGFKLYNLCQEQEPFIFIDADAIIFSNLDTLVEASEDKPFIAVNHEKIPGHTEHISKPFLNSGVQVVSDPHFLVWKNIIDTQNYLYPGRFVYPGTDQSILTTYCNSFGYDYTHPNVGYGWNSYAGITPSYQVHIKHYWYDAKPWDINCPLWNEFIEGQTDA